MQTLKKSAPYEDAEQKAIVGWLQRRGYFVFHIPNHKKMRQDIGALPGIPDLCLVLGMGQTIWIEMKRRKGGVLSDAQKKIHEDMRQLGHQIIIAKGAKDAFDQLKELGIGV